MSNLWIDVTNVLRWKGNPVGIVRVEAELIKYFLNKKVVFCYFDDKTGAFLKVDEQTIKNAIYSLQEIKKDKSIIENHSFIGKIKKEFFKSIKKSLPLSSLSYVDKTSEKISSIYYQFVLLPLQILKVKGFTRIFNINISKSESCFNNNDHFLSAGLHWDSDCLIILKSLKFKYNLHITTICYDLIPVLFPKFYLNKVKPLFAHYFKSLALVSNQVLCISENTKNDLDNWLKKQHMSVPKSTVITLGSDFLNKESSGEASKLVEEVIEEKYLLYVSTIEARKNHEVLIKAYESLIKEKTDKLPKLVFVGRIGWGVENLIKYIKNNPKISSQIVHLDNVTDDELISLYDHSLFCLYPSQYEGWGLPVAEALDRGKFCLCANNSSIPEVGKEFVDYIETTSCNEWSNGIEHYLNSSIELKKRESDIRLNYKSHTWNKFCKQIENLLF